LVTVRRSTLNGHANPDVAAGVRRRFRTTRSDAGIRDGRDFKALNAAAKSAGGADGGVWGYYKNGETVALPVSPADGYA